MKHEKNHFWYDLACYYYRTYGTTKLSLRQKVKVWMHNLGLHCVAVYRLGQWSRQLFGRNRLLGLLPMVLYKLLYFQMCVIYKIDIEAANIGPGLFVGHVGTIYIGPSEIGRNFCIAHNVTIGVGHTMELGETPTIGDNVWIGTGSVVTGAITIGSGTTISSGSMLSRDIPEGCLVAGNPARVISREYDNSRLIIVPDSAESAVGTAK